MNGFFPRAARWIGIPFIVMAGMRCAHVEAPSGGPVDVTRPVVAAVYPAPGATRVPSEARAIFQFSEWIDRGSNRGTIVVSPPYPGRVRVEVDGDKLIARPPAGSVWRSNETHVITVLGTLKDLRGNTMGKGFTLRFSTGHTLDSAGVEGRLAREGQRGALVAALYRMNDRDAPDALRALSPRDTGFTATPSPEPWRELPAYIAGADSTGAFRFDGARSGTYALFAFEDLNGNFAFDAGLEAAAPGSLALGLKQNAKDSTGQSLNLVPADTIPLRMVDVEFLPEAMDTTGKAAIARDTTFLTGVIHVKFSRDPHPTRAGEAARYAVVSDSGETIAATDAGWNPEANTWTILVPPLRANTRYRIAVRARPDFTGRYGADLPDTSALFNVGSPPPPLSGPPEWRLNPLSPFRGVDGKSKVSSTPAEGADQAFTSSLPLTPLRWSALERRLESHIRFTENDSQSVRVPLRLKRTDLHSFSAQLTKPLRAGSTLELKLRSETAPNDSTKSIVLFAGGIPDSTQTARVKLAPPPGRSDWLFWAQSTADTKLQVPLRRASSGDTLVSVPVPVGRYRVVAYRDTDGDGLWNAGSIRPWIPQEPFEVLADSLVAK